MSSALEEWSTARAARLDQLLAAHSAVGGRGPGRRYRTEQINRSLVLALVGEFQGFARRLHDLAAVHFSHLITGRDPILTIVVRELVTVGRALDRQNPTVSALSSDFGRLGLDLVTALRSRDVRSRGRLEALDTIVRLRNAIAHSDEGLLAQLVSAGHTIRKANLVGYGSKLNALARDVDTIVATHVARLYPTGPRRTRARPSQYP